MSVTDCRARYWRKSLLNSSTSSEYIINNVIFYNFNTSYLENEEVFLKNCSYEELPFIFKSYTVYFSITSDVKSYSPCILL